MSHAVYFVVPENRTPLIDDIAEYVRSNGEVDRIGCVTESRTDRRLLRTESSVTYDRVDLAPDLSPDAMADSDQSRSSPPVMEPAPVSRLRADYGLPFLTPFAVSDAQYDEVPRRDWQSLVERGFSYFESVLDEFDPTVLVTPSVSRPFEWIPARITSQQGSYYWWKTTRVGSRYGLIESSPMEKFCGITNRFENICENANSPPSVDLAREYLADVRESGSKPDFFERRAGSYGESLFKLVFPYGIPSPGEFKTFVQRRLLGTPTDYDDRRLPQAKNIIRRLQTRINDSFESPSRNNKFVYFPLHAQPEPSTRVLAPMFEDQIALAKQLARSLPVEYRLYVKDHPRMFRDNTRPSSYYRRLTEIPGVTVLSPSEDSHTIIEESAAVVSVVGTPAMEAAFLETPAIVFGPAHFTALPGIRRCRNFDALANHLSWALSDPESSEADIVAYLAALFESTFEVPSSARGSSPDAQRELAGCVAPVLLEAIES